MSFYTTDTVADTVAFLHRVKPAYTMRDISEEEDTPLYDVYVGYGFMCRMTRSVMDRYYPKLQRMLRTPVGWVSLSVEGHQTPLSKKLTKKDINSQGYIPEPYILWMMKGFQSIRRPPSFVSDDVKYQRLINKSVLVEDLHSL